ncbi:cytochrome P450 [Daldinia loculata]|uniref:cytochrome P450 n=1 Tax=Daldinia loculata TaxID=103429 RepID=UPI0020C3EEBA|nr:cytochrome P450 [Daldinia loculata]KAI1642067.1 cytochrome P450 [Daldinia loculata]
MLYPILLAAIAGLFAHNGVFIRGEWHLYIPQIVAVHFLLWLGTSGLVYQALGFVSVGDAFREASIIAASYFTAIFTSMTIYRLFFHRLSKFPGPKLAAVTKLWHVFKIRHSTNHLWLKELHEKYGSVIRTGPNEITIVHPAAFRLLDGWGTSTTKDIWYDILKPRSSAVFTRSEQEHKDGRRAWVQAISGKTMNSFNPRISQHVQELCECFRGFGGTQPVHIDEQVSRFTFDVVGDILFNQDWKLVKTQAWHPFFDHRDRAFELVGPINDVTWLAHMIFSLAPFWHRVQDWFKMVAFCEDRMKQRINEGDNIDQADMATHFIDEYQKLHRFHTIEERDLYLHGTAVTAVVAGSDTTRAALIASCWFLARYPEHAKKIYEETQGVDTRDPNALAALPHLEGFIQETLRLVPPAMTGAARITGLDGLMVDDILIPPYTKVTAPKYVIMRLESAFAHPNDFIPERWYSRPELILDKRAFGPFSTGGRQCVGKPIAYAELRLFAAGLVRDFHLKFAPGYDPMTMWREMKDQITAQPGPVEIIFEPREKAV